MHDFREFFKLSQLKLRMTFMGCSPLFLSDMMMFGGCSSFFDDGIIIYNTDTIKEMENVLISNSNNYALFQMKEDKICSKYYSLIASMYYIQHQSVSISVNASLYKEDQREDRVNNAYITYSILHNGQLFVNTFEVNFFTKNRYEQEKELVRQTLLHFQVFMNEHKINDESKPNSTN